MSFLALHVISNFITSPYPNFSYLEITAAKWPLKLSFIRDHGFEGFWMAENATFDSVVVSFSFSVVSPDGFKQVNFWVLAEQMTAKPVWGHYYFAYNWLKSEKKKNLHQARRLCFTVLPIPRVRSYLFLRYIIQ